MIWNNLSKGIIKEFHSNKDTFLSKPESKKAYTGEGKKILSAVKDDPNYPLVQDKHLHDQTSYGDGYSQTTLRSLLYIKEMKEYFDPMSIDFVTDFGPGYGGHIRVWHELFKTKHYQLVDLPELHEISKYHLGLHDITANHRTLDDMVKPHGKSLFYATHSFNELDLKTRTKVEMQLSEYDYLYIVYNKSFEGIDNIVWFDGLAKRLEKEYLIYTFMEQSTCKWRLVGIKK